MTELHLVLRPDGRADCVYSDKLPLRELGTLRTRRASNVEFDERTQEWVAITVEGRELARGPVRASVIAREVELLQSEL